MTFFFQLYSDNLWTFLKLVVNIFLNRNYQTSCDVMDVSEKSEMQNLIMLSSFSVPSI